VIATSRDYLQISIRSLLISMTEIAFKFQETQLRFLKNYHKFLILLIWEKRHSRFSLVIKRYKFLTATKTSVNTIETINLMILMISKLSKEITNSLEVKIFYNLNYL
jgi:hypothetical protein